jgi:hypothetical protein
MSWYALRTAISSVCWLVLRSNGRCAANLVMGRHTSTLTRFSSYVGRHRYFRIDARNGDKLASRLN